MIERQNRATEVNLSTNKRLSITSICISNWQLCIFSSKATKKKSDRVSVCNIIFSFHPLHLLTICVIFSSETRLRNLTNLPRVTFLSRFSSFHSQTESDPRESYEWIEASRINSPKRFQTRRDLPTTWEHFRVTWCSSSLSRWRFASSASAPSSDFSRQACLTK